MAPARSPRFPPAAAALAALLSLLLAAPGAEAAACSATIQSTLNCIDCATDVLCVECKPNYQLTIFNATHSFCTTPLPLGPASLGCYSTTTAWATSINEVIPGNAQPTSARCRSLAAAHSYTYFGMTGTGGMSGKCFMSNSTPETVAPGACTYSCPNTSPVEPCGGPKSGSTDFFTVYATAVPGGTCEGGWYDESNVCASCQVAECNTCSSPGSTCNTCKSGYYLASSTSCAPCSSGNCDVCSSGSAGACTKCKSGWALISGSCDGQCSDTTNCDACSSTVDGGCTKCKNGKVLDDGKCVGTCSTGKWNNNGKCDPCSNNCTSCSSASTCSVCATGYKVVSGVCQVSCSDTNCDICSTSGAGTCTKCNSGWALSSGACDRCDDADCDVCTNNGANSCTKCKNGKVLDDGKCVDTCPAGKWKNVDKCDPCKANCKSCSSGATCDVCNDNYWADNNGDCSNCPSDCKACPSSSSCTTCADGYELSGTDCVLSQVVCNPGTYSSNGVCNNCPETCSACTSSECTACNPGKKLHEGACLDSCPNEYYDESGVCAKCSNYCKTCTSNTTCTVCKTGYRLINNKCFVDTSDPHLMGFGGQSYSFCEHADGAHCLSRTFSVLSAPAYALNTHITRMAGPDAWPFAGAWMTGIGFRFGNILSVTLEMATDVEYKVVQDSRGEGTTRAVLPEDWSDVFESMHINGKGDMEELIGTGETLLFGVAGEVSVTFPFMRHVGDETDGTVAIIMTPGMGIKLFLDESLAWAPGVPAAIEGHELDYVVQGGLLATDFKFGRFEAAAGANAAAAAARRMLGRQPAFRRGGSRLA
ncbi:MAG: hypothetical protein J3K34DRAFT_523630 [Monoraphidium minutum]|nr:MAG: hypothetical protein J3K34DRAFT_523630 [Monoraphidium minutum]